MGTKTKENGAKMKSVLLEFSMFPTDVGESKSEYVSKIIEMVRESGVSYKLTPMSTVIETQSVKEALEIVEKSYNILEVTGVKRVYSVLKFDIRMGKEDRLVEKIKSVEEKIGEVNK